MAELEYQRCEVVARPDPAAGGGFTYSLPESERTLIRSVSFKLVTDANVAARLVSLDFIDGAGVVVARHSAGLTQAASLTTQYTFGVELNAYGANDAASIGAPLVPLVLGKGQSVTVNLLNHEAGDQISNIRLVVDQAGIIPDALP